MPKVIKGNSKTTEGFPVPHYSASSMAQFSTNPIIFKIRYINGDSFDTTKSIKAVMGTGFHKAMEIRDGGNEDIPISNEAEAIEMGLKVLTDYIDAYPEGMLKFPTAIPNKQKAVEKMVFAFNSYVTEVPYEKKGTEIIATEEEMKERVSIQWRGKKLDMPVPLKGYADKIVMQDGKLKIVDYKTSDKFSDPEKIDGRRILQAVTYYLLAYAKYGTEPYSVTYEEVKYTKNADGGKQVREYEMVFAENDLYFDFFFRFYEDITNALNGHQVYVPNIDAFYDNEVAMVAYIHRLDVSEEQAKMMKKLKVDNITDLLRKKIHESKNARNLMERAQKQLLEAKSINYEKMNNEEKIATKLLEHGMILRYVDKREGASVDLYRYDPTIGIRMKKLQQYTADIEQILGVSGVRILAPIPNTEYVGFEVPRKKRTFPPLPAGKHGFDIAIGETVMGEPRLFDIRTAPHMVIAGSTGSGKSVFLNSIIQQLAGTPRVDLHLYDPKKVELNQYEGVAKEYQDDRDAIRASLIAMTKEMDRRYAKMKDDGVKTIEQTRMPYKFVIIDEFNELAMRGGDGDLIKSIAQMGRAAGIHLIIATQRASTKVIDGDIKVNFPVKVVFRMAKAVDSTVMLDEAGAEQLLGKGDMLFATESGIERLQGYLTE